MGSFSHGRLVDEDDESPSSYSPGAVPDIRTRRKGPCASVSRFGMITLGMTVFAAAVIVSLIINILVTPSKEEYAISADSSTCAAVGRDVFLDKGSAVDAAIATLLCLGVVHPHSSGIGGGGFMVIHTPLNSTVYNFRESAPGASTTDMYGGDAERMEVGGLAIGVPGELKGLRKAWESYGSLPWKRLVMPAVKLARSGFPLEKSVVHALHVVYNETNETAEGSALFKPFRDVFMPNGSIPAEGTIITRPNLANALELIANNGSDKFYYGEIGKGIIEAVTSHGGIMTLEDLEQYSVKEERPVHVDLNHGWKLYGAPPPASGALIAFMSNILAGYNGLDDSVLSYHRMVEAFKFAYAQRSYLGDPHFNYSEGVDDLVTSKLLNASYSDWVRRQITDNTTHNVSYYGGEYQSPMNSGTTHVSVVRGSTSVAVTSTINTYFGALVMTKDGIILNNEMDDFSAPNITNFFGLPPSKPNFVEPNKRPQSSQSPTIVVDDKGTVRCVLGASGGTKITTNVYQVYANIHLKKQTVYNAVKNPRLHHQLLPDYVQAERELSGTIVQGLQKLHHMVKKTGPLAVVQAIERTENGTLRAQADVNRKGGASYCGTI